MSDTPLTDEELAAIASWPWNGHLVPRLIADLRAERDHSDKADAAALALLDEVADLHAEVERLREALRFYADAANWESKVLDLAPPGAPNGGAHLCESGPAWDGGERAREALA